MELHTLEAVEEVDGVVILVMLVGVDLLMVNQAQALVTLLLILVVVVVGQEILEVMVDQEL